MSMIYEQRLSDSPYLETVTRGHTTRDGSALRPAAVNWHMVFVRQHGTVQLLVVGPWTTAGTISYMEGAELLWVRFKLGTWMPHLPTSQLLDCETLLPTAGRNAFWLKGETWQAPGYEHVESFVDRLVRAELLVRDPIVSATLQGELPDVASRTLRHRFLRATGLSQGHIFQVKRAQQAASLLQNGQAIPDVMDALGYYDQPHLSRLLKRFTGRTPGEFSQLLLPRP